MNAGRIVGIAFCLLSLVAVLAGAKRVGEMELAQQHDDDELFIGLVRAIIDGAT